MKINFKDSYNKYSKSMINSYKEHVKPLLDKGVKYSKNLKKDTFEFVKKNPRKSAMIAAGGMLGISLIEIAVKAVKNLNTTKKASAVKSELLEEQAEINEIKSEHIVHQREVIDALKDDIACKQEIIDSLHDAVEAAHGELQKRKES